MTRFMKYPSYALLALLIAGPAHAQVFNDSVGADRLDNRMPGPPSVGSSSATHEARLNAAIPAGLRITSVTLEGSSLSAATVNAATKRFVGTAIDAPRLGELVEAVSAAYARSNVALYTVLLPEQTFANGQVKLVAIENQVEEVVLAGPDASKAGLSKSYVAHLAKQRPLLRPRLERDVLLMNDAPGVTVTPQIAPGSQPGSVKLLLNRTRKPIEGVVVASSRATERLGDAYIRGDVYFNGFGYEAGQTKLTAATSSDFDSFLSAGLSHTATFGPWGTSLSGSVGYFHTRTDDTNIEGEGKSASLQLAHPLIRSSAFNLYLAGGVDGVDSENALVGLVVSSDKTRAGRLAFSAGGQHGRTAYSFGGSVSQGLDVLDAQVADPTNSKLEFFKTNMQAAVTHSLNDRWRIAASAAGQIADDALPAAELMSLGGAVYGRAFDAGAIQGDSGISGLAEISRSMGEFGWVKASELYVFGDAGRVWLSDRPGLTLNQFDLASAGLGMRMGIFDNVSLDLQAAHALDVVVEGVDDHKWLGTISLSAAF